MYILNIFKFVRIRGINVYSPDHGTIPVHWEFAHSHMSLTDIIETAVLHELYYNFVIVNLNEAN